MIDGSIDEFKQYATINIKLIQQSISLYCSRVTGEIWRLSIDYNYKN
jgi:hypothetical protein